MKRKGTEPAATVPGLGRSTGSTMVGSPGSEPVGDLSAVSDADLITLVTQGNQDALGMLYERYSRAVYSFSLRIVGDAQVAEEILQEVFVRAWQQGGSFQSARGSLITWLLSITHNLSIDEVRRRMAERYAALRVGPAMDDLDVGPVISPRQREIVQGFLAIARSTGLQVAAQATLPASLPAGGCYVPPTLLAPKPADAPETA